MLVGIYGLVLLAKRRDMPRDLIDVFRWMAACYLLVVAADFINGGGWSNFQTVTDYLPLLALAPYAYAIRQVGITPRVFDWTIAAAILLAVLVSSFRVAILGESRPGGFHVASVGYGVVISVLATLLFSRAFEAKSGQRWWFAISAAAFLPVLLSGSKIAIICIVTGFLIVGFIWVRQSGRWRAWTIGLIVASVSFCVVFYWTAYYRLQSLLYELHDMYLTGKPVNESFGGRYAMNESSLRAFWEKPLFGHGLAERVEVMRAHATPGGVDFSDLPYIHSDYATHLVAFGICGAAFLLLYLFSLYRLSNRSGDVAYRRAGIAIVAMLAVYMTADVAFNMDPIGGILTLAFGIILSVPPRPAPAPSAIDGISTNSG